jgi:hypothetical protein
VIRLNLTRRMLMHIGLSGLLVASAVACQDSEDEGVGGVVTVLDAIARAQSVSVLAVNLEGLRQEYGLPSGASHIVPWWNRYNQIAEWMNETGTRPDLISLQEVYGERWGGGSGPWVKDYETLTTIVEQIKVATDSDYRIAFLHVGFISQGPFGGIWSGRAILYNNAVIRNATPPAPAGETVRGYDDWGSTGLHVRSSMPCDDPARAAACTADLDTVPAWTILYAPTAGGRNSLGASVGRFELRTLPGWTVDMFDVHLNSDDPRAFAALNDVVSEFEARFPPPRAAYPPIVAGDFNVSPGDMKKEMTQPDGVFDRFEPAGLTTADVMAIIVGRRSEFRSQQEFTTSTQIEPFDKTDYDKECIKDEEIWGDHCAIFVQFRPG